MPPKKKRISGFIKLQINAGAATPAPPVGPALGQHGVNIMEFVKAYNAATESQRGNVIPVEITVYEDRSFTFVTKTPPAAELIKKAAGVPKGSGEPHKTKVATLTADQVRAIAEQKMEDLNANDVEAAAKIIAGTARSMGITTPGYSTAGPTGIRPYAGPWQDQRWSAPHLRRSLHGDSTETPPGPPTRTTKEQHMKRSKAYTAAAEKLEPGKVYSPLEAVRLAKDTSLTKYDATVEVAMRLGVDPRKSDQMVRGTVNLPHGTGKTARVLVFANGDRAEQAREAGADHVGSDDMIEKVSGGWLDFDAVVATPDMMGKVGRLGKVLGPRGLMPNPKTGTVTMDVAKAVTDIKGGKIEFRVDKHANLHFIIGKASFDEKSLVENYAAALEEVLRLKPSSSKGHYIEKATMATTMGPGIPLDYRRTRNLLVEDGADATA